MVFDDPWRAMLPALDLRRPPPGRGEHHHPDRSSAAGSTINPLMILLALSFWAWVWGTTGALLAVPLLIILRTVFAAAGKPDIAGFLFEEGTLIQD